MDKITKQLREDFIKKWIYEPTGSKKINDFQLVSITAKRNRAVDDINEIINSVKEECAEEFIKTVRKVITTEYLYRLELNYCGIAFAGLIEEEIAKAIRDSKE